VQKLDWSINASRYESDGFSAIDPAMGPKWADDDSYDITNYSLKLGYDLSERADLYLVSYYINSYSEFDPSAPWAPDPTSVHEDNFSETEQFFAKAGGRFELSQKWVSELALAYSNVNSLSVSSFGPYPSDGDRYKYQWQNTLTISDSWNLIAGIEFEDERNRSGAGERDTISYFAENVVAANENLDISFGVRHDKLDITETNSDLTESRDETTWRSSFSYRLDEANTRIHGSFGTSFQAPTTSQLFGFYGNPNLTPESGNGWDFGIEKNLADQNLWLSSTVFGYDIEEHIYWDQLKGAWGAYENNDYKSKGLETSIRWHGIDNVNLGISHTYTDAVFYRDGEEYENTSRTAAEAERAPRNIYAFNAGWRTLENKLSLNTLIYHASSQYSSNKSIEKQPGYTTVNLSARYDLNESTEIWVRVDNLLDKDYEEIKDYQTAGLSLYTGFRYAF